MDDFLTVAGQVGILFALMSAGWACRRAKILDESAVRGLVALLVVVVTPALIIDAFQRPFDLAMLRGLGFAAAAAAASYIVTIPVAIACIRHSRPDTAAVLRVGAVFSNAGFMGIPLDQALFGSIGVFYGTVYIGVFNVFIWAWGASTIRRHSSGQRDDPIWKSLLLNPGTIGLAIALPLYFGSCRLPVVVHGALGHLSALNTPLAMLVIGYHLGGARFGKFVRDIRAWAAVVFRLAVFPVMTLGALYWCARLWSMPREMCVVVVVSAAAPTAALTSMLAARYNADVDISVGMVSVTTLLSMFTLPLIIALAMAMF